jgi:hypothetical protein
VYSGRERHLAWDQVRTADRGNRGLLFRGIGSNGRKIVVYVWLIGHKRKTVTAVVLSFRPDLAKALA